ncbi:DUF11 domain-containing protein [Frigoribacterium sp. PhB24]|uniref:DUF11 domain-containing protein n=1 Tax=Frigoribacterium sp. PhB24 TaxID=2485204 RepID=UPI000F4A82F8|nr:DUF11 domain-containing protein [Frigoribacterium sp. PhB24]ROS48417.1 putative repeat protein (TIGR01451 family) [Frigoribacterium sp. PhB24]
MIILQSCRPGLARRSRALLGATGVLLLASIGAGLPALPATAASTEPVTFDLSHPNAYVSLSTGTNADGRQNMQLFEAVRTKQGGIDYREVGVPWDYYNALSYREKDRLAYAFAQEDHGYGLLRVDAHGRVTELGHIPGTPDRRLTAATFGSGPFSDTMFASSHSDPNVYALDFSKGIPTHARTIVPDASIAGVSDWAEKDGYLWGVDLDSNWVRLNTATGHVDTGPVEGNPSSSSGYVVLAWAYPNGDFVFGNRSTLFQYRADNGLQKGQTLKLVARQAAPITSKDADGMYVGAATNPAIDLAVEITAVKRVFAGEPITYTLAVTNASTGVTSSGAVVTDDIPAGLGSVTIHDQACQLTGRHLACSTGALKPGASQQFSFTVDTAADSPSEVENFATVSGNETDPNLSNNTSSVSTRIVPAADENTNANASASAGADANANPAAVAAAMTDGDDDTRASAAADSKANAAAQKAAKADASKDASAEAKGSAQAAAQTAAMADASDNTQAAATAATTADASSAAKAAAIADASKDASVDMNTNANASASAGADANANPAAVAAAMTDGDDDTRASAAADSKANAAAQKAAKADASKDASAEAKGSAQAAAQTAAMADASDNTQAAATAATNADASSAAKAAAIADASKDASVDMNTNANASASAGADANANPAAVAAAMTDGDDDTRASAAADSKANAAAQKAAKADASKDASAEAKGSAQAAAQTAAMADASDNTQAAATAATNADASSAAKAAAIADASKDASVDMNTNANASASASAGADTNSGKAASAAESAAAASGQNALEGGSNGGPRVATGGTIQNERIVWPWVGAGAAALAAAAGIGAMFRRRRDVSSQDD